MALVACQECKAEISDAATACPKCGHPNVRMPQAKVPAVNPMNPTVTAGQGCLIVLLVLGAAIGFAVCSGSTDSNKPHGPAAESRPTQTPEQVEAEKKASAERGFKRDAEVDAEMHVHKALIQERGRSMPDNWKEKGEMIRREGDFAMVLVRTGIKEGMLSPLVTVQSYLVSVHMNMPGDRVYLSAAQRCGDPPAAAVVAMMMIQNEWPSAMATMNAQPATAKKRRKAADE